MSNHPYGLRGDPFSSPATLSAKDASKLIRRRVRAFNGDGGALFPIDTCDLIHDLAGGIPDAMLQLAGRAMRIAAEEGAPAVSPAHVRKAADSAPAESPEPGPSAAREAARALDEEIEAAEVAVNAAIAAAMRANAEAREEAHETPAPAAAAIDFEDPDLPPFQPAPFALPTQPSENLDPDARDWVSRFMGGSSPTPAGIVHARRTTTTREVVPEPEMAMSASAEPAGSMPELAAVYAAHAPKPRFRPVPRRRRGRQGGHGLILAFAAIAVVAFVVRMSVRGNLIAPWTQPDPPARASAPAFEPPAPEPAPGVHALRPADAERTTAPEPGSTPTGHPPVGDDAEPRQAASLTNTSMVAPATLLRPVDTAARATPLRPAAPFGLEVATFIFEDRARTERDRLSGYGLRARVVTTVEYGSRVYRVVLSGYADPAAAERAADSLLTVGAVLQARVIRVP